MSMSEDINNIVSLGKKEPMKENELTPDRVTLADGSPIINVFLSEDAIVLDHAAHENASTELREIITSDPKAVLECQGMSLAEARARLLPIAERNRRGEMGAAA